MHQSSDVSITPAQLPPAEAAGSSRGRSRERSSGERCSTERHSSHSRELSQRPRSAEHGARARGSKESRKHRRRSPSSSSSSSSSSPASPSPRGKKRRHRSRSSDRWRYMCEMFQQQQSTLTQLLQVRSLPVQAPAVVQAPVVMRAPVAPPSQAASLSPLRHWNWQRLSWGGGIEDALSVLASEGAEEREVFFSEDPALDSLPLIPLPRELIPLMRRANDALRVPWPSATVERCSVYDERKELPSEAPPIHPDFWQELTSSWKHPATAPAVPRSGTTYRVHEGDKMGLVQFPPVGSTIPALAQPANLALLSKDAACPNKQCRVTEVLLKKAYSANAFVARLSNYNTCLVAYQSHPRLVGAHHYTSGILLTIQPFGGWSIRWSGTPVPTTHWLRS
ncbi:UNVERIFIED_CONTAM: hypothetical protein FKN15_061754 [Acipenser sinensis]